MKAHVKQLWFLSQSAQHVLCLKRSYFLTFCSFYFSCQDVFLDNVELGNNIARNQALKENVFMMVVCVELRIPLFLIGKPGSSKSLAKTIVASAMQGRTGLFKQLKKVKLELKGLQSFCQQLCGSATSTWILVPGYSSYWTLNTFEYICCSFGDCGLLTCFR